MLLRVKKSCFPSQSTKTPHCQCRTLTVFHFECFYTSDLCFSVAVIAPSLFTSFLYIFFYDVASPDAHFKLLNAFN